VRRCSPPSVRSARIALYAAEQRADGLRAFAETGVALVALIEQLELKAAEVADALDYLRIEREQLRFGRANTCASGEEAVVGARRPWIGCQATLDRGECTIGAAPFVPPPQRQERGAAIGRVAGKADAIDGEDVFGCADSSSNTRRFARTPAGLRSSDHKARDSKRRERRYAALTASGTYARVRKCLRPRVDAVSVCRLSKAGKGSYARIASTSNVAPLAD